MKLQQTCKAVSLMMGRHGPCLCHHLQGQAQNSLQMGEQGVCGGMATLPKPTSICGMSHRWGRVQLYPAQKLLLPISNNLEQEEGENSVKRDGCSDEPTPVPHENDALLVDCLTESWQEGMPNTPSKQHEPFDPGSNSWIPQVEGSKLTMMHMFHQGECWEQWGTNPHGGIRILCYSKMTSFPVPSIFELSYASAFTSSHACTWSLWGIQCENTLFEPPTTTNLPNTLKSWHWWGCNPCWLCGGFLDEGSGPKDIWSEHNCPTGETKKTSPNRGPVGVWAVQPWRYCAQ